MFACPYDCNNMSICRRFSAAKNTQQPPRNTTEEVKITDSNRPTHRPTDSQTHQLTDSPTHRFTQTIHAHLRSDLHHKQHNQSTT